ncbi:MAG: heparan-alpha-glucosaminide N-acetyltransferase domain-containing protein [Candidatus Rokuibacteriota bacterium]
MAQRLVFVDALRGLALVLMVLNHTARWWLPRSLGLPRFELIYVTLTLAAPVFLFLVGFGVALSARRAGGARLTGAGLLAYWRRGLGIVLAGLLLNVLVFPEDPWWSGGVLQTIGLGIIVAAPLLPLAARRSGQGALALGAVFMYLAFAWAHPWLVAWLPAHSLVAQVLFFDFAPWPWVAIVVLGLVAGALWTEAERRSDTAQARYVAGMLVAGAALVVLFLGHAWWNGLDPLRGYERDFSLNRHWLPRGVTLFWIVGMIGMLFAAMHWLAEVRRLPMGWLVTFGRTAMMLYFVHQVIAYRLGKQTFALSFDSWWAYAGANLLFLALLLGLAELWLRLKPRLRRPRPLAAPASGAA